MPAPYTVIDAATDGVYGPFPLLKDALACAQDFERYEVLDCDGALVDWRGALPRPPADDARVASAVRGAGAKKEA
jgi:hypothetical protein